MQAEDPQQLALQVYLRDTQTFDNFVIVETNEIVVTTMRELVACSKKARPRQVFIHGESGSGKSHLLQAACNAVDDQGGRAIYLPMVELISQNPEHLLEHSLEQLQPGDLICLDDLQVIAGKANWEEALFHLYNRAMLGKTSLLFAAQASPRQLEFGLADLKSRLNATLVYQLQAMPDEDKCKLLIMRALARGLTLSEETAIYIIHRSSRNTVDLLELLDRLDQAALVQQRKLTIPFIKQVMSW